MSISNIIRTAIVALVLLISTMGYAQQESQYTQFMYNQLYLNPAYAGARDMASLSAIYRNQWIGFEGSPESKLISFNTPLLGKRIGLGVTLANHTIGLMNSWNGSMAYSYKLQITNDAAIRFGLQGTMRYLGLDFEDPEVYIREPGDPSFSETMESKYTGNFGMGIYFNFKQLYVGVSVPNFFPNEITLNKVPSITNVAKEVPHYYLMVGTMFELSETVALKPAALLKYVENAPLDLDVNISAVFDYRITVGASYRAGGEGSGDSVDLLAMYQYRNIALGLAYDFGLSALSQESSGSFEALLRYDFFKSQDDIANPRFFF